MRQQSHPTTRAIDWWSCAANHSLAATINAANCTQSTVQAAINSAADGDTVTVPAGTCTWSAAVSISNKTITLRGAGSGSGGTKITYGGSGHTCFPSIPAPRQVR